MKKIKDTFDIRKGSNKLHPIWNFYLRTRYGVGCCDLWGLDYFLAKIIIRPLKRFRKLNKTGYPAELKSMDEWRKILDKMIWSFEYSLRGELTNDTVSQDEYEKLFKKEQEGFELFGKYFRDLWM